MFTTNGKNAEQVLFKFLFEEKCLEFKNLRSGETELRVDLKEVKEVLLPNSSLISVIQSFSSPSDFPLSLSSLSTGLFLSSFFLFLLKLFF